MSKFIRNRLLIRLANKKHPMNDALTNIDQLFKEQYGSKGSDSRVQFEQEARAFLIAEQLKEERRLANLT
jgi:HTH-type transcriptional regulator / antitoxin HipB